MVDGIVIKEKDNVATALRDIEKDETVVVAIGEEKKELVVCEPIPFGHKFSIRDIQKGENIFKYEEVIGRAIYDIPEGGHAHIHNIESLRGRGDLNQENLNVEI
jgi:altronate dehydratase small subunit